MIVIAERIHFHHSADLFRCEIVLTVLRNVLEIISHALFKGSTCIKLPLYAGMYRRNWLKHTELALKNTTAVSTRAAGSFCSSGRAESWNLLYHRFRLEQAVLFHNCLLSFGRNDGGAHIRRGFGRRAFRSGDSSSIHASNLVNFVEPRFGERLVVVGQQCFLHGCNVLGEASSMAVCPEVTVKFKDSADNRVLISNKIPDLPCCFA